MHRFPNPVCQTCPHRHGHLMSCCSPEELDFVTANKSSQVYQKGQVIFQEGNMALGMYCVHQGKIKISKVGGDSKEQIIRLARQGDALGFRALLMGGRYSATAVALEDCVVCYVPRLDFLRLVQSNTQFSSAIMQLLAQSLGEAEQQMLHLAYKPVRERLAGALLLLQQTFRLESDELPFRIALAREDVAALVGTAKETVSRLLSEFKDAGIIATRGSQITILKPKCLSEIATLYN